MSLGLNAALLRGTWCKHRAWLRRDWDARWGTPKTECAFSNRVPAQGLNNPLANALRFSLKFDFEGFRQQAEPETGR